MYGIKMNSEMGYKYIDSKCTIFWSQITVITHFFQVIILQFLLLVFLQKIWEAELQGLYLTGSSEPSICLTDNHSCYNPENLETMRWNFCYIDGLGHLDEICSYMSNVVIKA